MARPRVFVSSTYYDLKHLRSSLENFIQSLGFDAILSEKGKIAYMPDLPLDESCYKEVGTADIFVLIIGGRYGSEVSATKTGVPKTFSDRYNSITRGEYRSAVERDVPTYVLVERSVYAEYETYLQNKHNKRISYAHVDSVNIFELIEDILSQPRNNPIQQFDRYSEVEAWLREQWAGLFRELLQRVQSQTQIASLQAQVAQLAELNTTLKRYLEEIVSKIAPRESQRLIKTETKRLEDAKVRALIRKIPIVIYLTGEYGLPQEVIEASARDAISLRDFVERLGAAFRDASRRDDLRDILLHFSRDAAARDLNAIRLLLGEKRIRIAGVATEPPVGKPKQGQKRKRPNAALQPTSNN